MPGGCLVPPPPGQGAAPGSWPPPDTSTCRRTRILTSPYLYLPLPRLPGALPSSHHPGLHRLRYPVIQTKICSTTCRGRVRFKDLGHQPSPGPAYPLDEELTSRLEAIRLEPGARSGEQESLGGGGQVLSEHLCSEVNRSGLQIVW